MAIVGNTYEILKKSPLFNLSLASKELFHSNFIAWYAENYRENFIAFINCCLLPKITWSEGWNEKWKVLRESKNYDICIKDGDGNIRLIIENKVKSIPYKEQLEGYKDEIQNSINKKFKSKNNCKSNQIIDRTSVAYILLSLSTDFPDRDDIEKDWTIINYGDLAMYLKNKHNYKVDYKDQLVLDYADFITNLQELEKHWAEETAKENLDGTTFLLNFKADKVDQVQSNEDDGHRNESESDNPVGNTSEYERAKELRIHDLYGKTRAQRICMRLKEKLPQELKQNVSWGFTNGTPILQVKWPSEHIQGKNEYEEFFIQIQGNQYRHAVNLVNRKDCNDNPLSTEQATKVVLSDSGEKHLANKKYADFYSNYPDVPNVLINGKKCDLQNNKITNYCQYGGHPNGGLCSFVYYYKKISPYSTIQDILDIIVKDVKNNFNF